MAVHDVGTAGDGVFVAMELVSGQTVTRGSWRFGQSRYDESLEHHRTALAVRHASAVIFKSLGKRSTEHREQAEAWLAAHRT